MVPIWDCAHSDHADHPRVIVEILSTPLRAWLDGSSYTPAPLLLLSVPAVRLQKRQVSETLIILRIRFKSLHLPFSACATLAIRVGKFLGIRYTLTGVDNLRRTGGVVLINHQSFLDLVVLGYLWHHLGPAAVIAKKEIMYLPPVGISIWSYGSIFIDRSNKGAARKSIERASEAINRDKKKLIFFPEGTRSVQDTLLPFRNGAFVSAFDNQCFVYPVVVSKFTFLDHARKLFTPGEGFISILEPVNSADFRDFKELRDHCQSFMQSEYDRLNGLLITKKL